MTFGKARAVAVAAALFPAAVGTYSAAAPSHDAARGANSTTTYRITVSPDGLQVSGYTETPRLSADGRYVAFMSAAPDLVGGDTNGVSDVFVRDLDAGLTRLVSVSSSGEQANLESYGPAISADGRYVAFVTDASNLVPGDTNGATDVFMRDLATGVTQRVSVNSSGHQQNGFYTSAPGISADGRYVVFASNASNLVRGDTNGYEDVFRHNVNTGVTRRVSVSSSGQQANYVSDYPVISGSGGYVAFVSNASNLVPGDGNGVFDVFRHNMKTGLTRRMSVNSNNHGGRWPSYSPAISDNGRYVAFSSRASNLVAGDTNEMSDVFLRDPVTGVTQRVSVSSSGQQGGLSSGGPMLSPGGHRVAFVSDAWNLVPGDTNGFSDVFVRNLQTGTTRRVSLTWDGHQADDDSYHAGLCADWRLVVFISRASNLVPGDTNDTQDVFARVHS